MWRKVLIGVICTGIAAAAAAAEEDHALSLREALTIALRNNPDHQAVLASKDVRKFQQDEAAAALLPAVDASVGIGRERSTSLSLRLQEQANRNLLRQEAGVIVQQVLFDGFSSPARRAAARARVTQASADVVSSREQLALELAGLYLQAARNRELMALAQTYTREHEEILALLQQRHAAGISRLSEVTLAQVRVARFRAILAELTETDQQIRILLEQKLLQRVPAIELAAAERLVQQAEALPASAWEILRSGNPAIRGAEAAVQAARQDLRGARGSLFPTVSVNGEVEYLDNAAGVQTYEVNQRLMLRSRWALYTGGARPARIGGRAAELARAQAELRSVEERVREIWRQAQNRINSTAEILAQVGEGLADARKTERIYREQYLAAERSLLDVLDLTTEIYVLERQRQDMMYEQAMQRLQILALEGRLAGMARHEPQP